MSVLTSWVAKLVVSLAVVSLLAFNAIEVLVAHVGGKSDANEAAYAAANTWQATHNPSQVLAAARAAVPHTDRVPANGCHATNATGTTWVCTLRRPARTFLMADVGLKKYTVATESGRGSYAP